MRRTLTLAGTVALAAVLGGVGAAGASPSPGAGGPAAAVTPSAPAWPGQVRRDPATLQRPATPPPRDHAAGGRLGSLPPGPGGRLDAPQRRQRDGMPRALPERPGPVRMPHGRPTLPPPVPMPPARDGDTTDRCPGLRSVGPVACGFSPRRTGH